MASRGTEEQKHEGRRQARAIRCHRHPVVSSAWLQINYADFGLDGRAAFTCCATARRRAETASISRVNCSHRRQALRSITSRTRPAGRRSRLCRQPRGSSTSPFRARRRAFKAGCLRGSALAGAKRIWDGPHPRPLRHRLGHLPEPPQSPGRPDGVKQRISDAPGHAPGAQSVRHGTNGYWTAGPSRYGSAMLARPGAAMTPS